MRTRKPITGLLVVVSLVASLVAACGDDADTRATDDTAGEVVHVKVFAFAPTPLKVASGTKVTWVNDDDITHTATSGKRTYEPGDTGKVIATEKDGAFDIVLDGAGKRGSHTFAKPGSFHYFCDRHPGMEAEVVVS